MMKIRYVLLLAFMSTLCGAPKGFNVISGHATIMEAFGQIVVKTRGDTVIEWKEFSLSTSERLHFLQKSPSSTVTNRIVGGRHVRINGNIVSNGKVVLTSGSGFVIGPKSHIQTADFIATTGELTGTQTKSITDVSDGEIQAQGFIEALSGDILLVGSRITQKGTLAAPHGMVGMAVGDEIHVMPSGAGRIHIEPSTAPAQSREIRGIVNGGFIKACTTEIKTQSNAKCQAIVHVGKIEALSLGDRPGSVTMEAADSWVSVLGSIRASGGLVHVLGREKVALLKNGCIDVSHPNKPGEVFFGGSAHGQNRDIVHTKHAWMDKTASINADASERGNGGRVIMWADEHTHFEGRISAEARGAGGNGGWVEVSSKGDEFAFKGAVSVDAKNGEPGKVVLDPKRVLICGDERIVAPGTLVISGNALASALQKSNVIIQADVDITIDDHILSETYGNGLMLHAGKSVSISPQRLLDLNHGAFSVQLDDPEGSFEIQEGAQVVTHGADILLNGQNLNLK